MLGQTVHTLMQHPSEDEVEAALEASSTFFWVDWREDDDRIPGLCEAVPKTGEFSADWDENDSLVVVWRSKGFPVPLTKTPLTRITSSWVFYSVYWMLRSFISDLEVERA